MQYGHWIIRFYLSSSNESCVFTVRTSHIKRIPEFTRMYNSVDKTFYSCINGLCYDMADRQKAICCPNINIDSVKNQLILSMVSNVTTRNSLKEALSVYDE